MTDPFVGEIRAVGFNFAPNGWAFCQGQLLPIMQNTALFSLLGTNYGGDGKSTFALPNLQGVAPMGTDQDYYSNPGITGGSAAVTLLQSEMPQHTHSAQVAASTGTTSNPAGAALAIPRSGRLTEPAYGTGPTISLAPDAFGVTGGSQPHNNMQPFLVVNYIIALQGVFPPRS
jgi:microcystin-dependent protein